MQNALSRLIDAFRCLPGIGPKSAQRMVFHLLQHQRQRGLHLAECLQEAMQSIRHCNRCNNYTATEQCDLCLNETRDKNIICIVDSPVGVEAIEQSRVYNGSYFVLMGKISPLDGLGPQEIGLPKLEQLIAREPIKEIIIAISPSVEGLTTLHFIQELLHPHSIKMSQLAQGIPMGGELEFLDSYTISSALKNRSAVIPHSNTLTSDSASS